MRLPFELDPEIIHHIIYSQAGSIGKAIIELLMNSVDAGASFVRLTITKEGFSCVDDGNGFASREDVLRYFGRFGTPHQEGDATYGRFRLGRGQIMAHASTIWQSNEWQMAVDTRTMGYAYDLDEIDPAVKGCSITGMWYEALTETEMMSTAQEVRDLVRYTPIAVELNGRVITRDPRKERWDFEDEFAYYRAREDGAVSIYNQGVLVRHDPAHIWGAGGLIVTKRAIGLNVSRTEILRKSCPVWKPIAKEFGRLADAVAARLGSHRKTEARREKSARALMASDADILTLYEKEEVVTILPGKRHVTMNEFLRKAHWQHKGRITVIENGFDVPKGEAIARESVCQVVHPQTLERFGCYNPEDFLDALCRIVGAVNALIEEKGRRTVYFHGHDAIKVPELVDFTTLRDSFVERTRLVLEKEALDKETRRAWVALRWALQQYAGLCAGGQPRRDGSFRWDSPHRMHILLGESNRARAWTDGETYIAIDVGIVRRLKADPLRTASLIFNLIEHEVAHKGDSLDCGHDEAFYQRYHDISIAHAPERQRYLHMWLMKYARSMEAEGLKGSGRAWSEQRLAERVGSGRQKRGLPGLMEDVSNDPVLTTPAPAENMALIDLINAGLVQSGQCPSPPDWEEVLTRARAAQMEVAERQRQEAARAAAVDAEALAEQEAWMREEEEYMQGERTRFAIVLGVAPSEIDDKAFNYLFHSTSTEEQIRAVWATKEWLIEQSLDDFLSDEYLDRPAEGVGQESVADRRPVDDGLWRLDERHRALVQSGENMWALERNAAAAGFHRVEPYLRWRAEEDSSPDGAVN